MKRNYLGGSSVALLGAYMLYAWGEVCVMLWDAGAPYWYLNISGCWW